MARDKAELFGYLLLALAILAYFYFARIPQEGVSVTMVGQPFTIVNGMDVGSQVAFTLTTTMPSTPGSLPANITITQISGNSENLNGIISNLTQSMANLPKQSNPGDTKTWVSSPIGLTALPDGQYSLTWVVVGANLNPDVAPFTKQYTFNFTIVQQKAIILSESPVSQYSQSCGTIDYGRIYNIQVNAPATLTFQVGGSGCGDYPLNNCHWGCVKRCSDASCSNVDWSNCQVVYGTTSSNPTIATVSIQASSSGYYMIWRGAQSSGSCGAPNTYGRLTNYGIQVS